MKRFDAWPSSVAWPYGLTLNPQRKCCPEPSKRFNTASMSLDAPAPTAAAAILPEPPDPGVLPLCRPVGPDAHWQRYVPVMSRDHRGKGSTDDRILRQAGVRA
ncbi:hypothetical protein GCM10010376_09180 [Streptomyces violaceusniger]